MNFFYIVISKIYLETFFNFLGEFTLNGFVGGVIKKPSLESKIRIITNEELNLVIGDKIETSAYLGKSPLYDLDIRVNINDLFSNHFAIFGNTGSGKSCTIASMLQTLYKLEENSATGSTFIFFDVNGEYKQAFEMKYYGNVVGRVDINKWIFVQRKIYNIKK